MQKSKSAVSGEVVDSAAKHGVSSTLGAIHHCEQLSSALPRNLFCPLGGETLLQPALPPPGRLNRPDG